MKALAMANRGPKKQISYELVVSSEPEPKIADTNSRKSDAPVRPYTTTQKSLLFTGVLNLAYFLAQLVVAARSHSLSMLSDAFHTACVK